MRKIIMTAMAATAAAVAVPATAQVDLTGGLVVVDLAVNNVANNIARDLDVNVSNIPVTVQVPVGIAANVCDVNANVLAKQLRTGDAKCDAKNTSGALNKIVQRQMTEQ